VPDNTRLAGDRFVETNSGEPSGPELFSDTFDGSDSIVLCVLKRNEKGPGNEPGPFLKPTPEEGLEPPTR
jgi:hypothetical protein